MVSINEVYNKIILLNREVMEIQKRATGSNEMNEIGEQIEKPKNPDEAMKYDFVIRTLDKLDDISRDVSYLQKPVRFRGVLYRNSRGRFEIPEYEWTSGRGIEVLIENAWIHSRVEHDGKDYYIVGYSSVPMDGLKVRIR